MLTITLLVLLAEHMSVWTTLPLHLCTALSTFSLSLRVGALQSSSVDKQEVAIAIMDLLPPTVTSCSIEFYMTTVDVLHPRCALSLETWARFNDALTDLPLLKDFAISFVLELPAGYDAYNIRTLPRHMCASIRELLPCLGVLGTSNPSCRVLILTSSI